jgi:hypothetical protein
VKDYTGSCYIGVVGGDEEIGMCRDSIENIKRRKTDTRPHYIRATKGYEARQMHLNKWYYETKHAFILLLDHDMLFPENTLERLRAHKAPFVSGFYMRRTIRPVYPVWFERGETGVMPLRPLTAALETNKTYPIGASGWGCMLIHRDVVTAVKGLLKGEPEIIEDDMDVHPYDLTKVMTAIRQIDANPDDTQTVRRAMDVLKDEIRPLRGVKDTVGSDIRFPFYAQIAGFPLMGDTGVCCEHVTYYPVSMSDWLNQPVYNVRDMSLAINDEDRKERERLRKAIA